MIRIILALTLLLLIPQSAAAIQDNDTELRLIEAEDPIVQQQGEWTLVEDTENASGEGYLASSRQSDDELGLLFEGTRIEVIYLTAPNYGTFHIEVDNEIVQTVDTASDEPQFDVRAVVEDLEPGFHIIRVIADSGAIAVDGLEIIGTSDIQAISLLDKEAPHVKSTIERAEQVSGIHVVIGFYVPPGFQSEVNIEEDEDTVIQQRQNILLVRNTILQELREYDVTIVGSTEWWALRDPYMTLILGQDAFQHLITLPYINFIRQETLGRCC